MEIIKLDGDMLSRLSIWKERFVYALIMLFPVAGVGVRHWYSSIFSVLALIALWDLIKTGINPPLYREERVWVWLCAIFFFTYILCAFANGGISKENNYFNVEARYLFLVPLYVMLRNYKYAWRCLLVGLMMASVYITCQAYYEVTVLNNYRVLGAYSPNLLGPVTALMAVWLLASWRFWNRLRWLIPVMVVAALWVVVVSGSRGAYLGAVVMCLVWAWFCFRGYWRMLPIAVILLAPLLAYNTSERFSQRMDQAEIAVKDYVQNLDESKRHVDGTTLRFEMWRVGWMIFKDNPVFGVGRGNYTKAVKQYVGVDGIPEAVASHGHAHNAYVDIIIARGSVGFIAFMGMLFYPLYYLLKTRHISPDTAIFGILHVVGFAVFSITDASTFIKGNFVAVYLVFMSVFFSHHVAQVRQKDS